MSVRFEFDHEKAIAATLYIIGKGLPELTMAKLFKLLFFSDKDHLVRHSRPIMGDYYAAMKDGPVPSNLYDLFKELENGPTTTAGQLFASHVGMEPSLFQDPRLLGLGNIDPMQLSELDIESLDRVTSDFGLYSFLRLRALTHETPAYENAWESRGIDYSIPMDFADFFEEDADAILVREKRCWKMPD